MQLPAGANWELGAAHLSLGGGDLVVGGRLALGSGQIDGIVGFDLLPGGRVDAGDGTLRVAGPWRNAGQFDAGTSLVEFVDGGIASAEVIGSTRFHDARWISSIGKTWRFDAGTTQTFGGRLEVQGVPGVPIRFTSDAPGQFAFFELLPGGTQDIGLAAVTDVQSTGQPLAPTELNQGGSNAPGWFSGIVAGVMQIPVLSNAMLALLAAFFLLIAFRSRRS